MTAWPTVDTSYGTLSINSTSMQNYAWMVRDVRQLYAPQKYRGRNIIIPNVAGSLATRYRITEAAFSLKMWFTGVCDTAGSPHANRFTGFQTNLDAFTAAILEPPAGGTYAATLTMPDASTRTADVQVLGFEFDPVDRAVESPYKFDATLSLLIPEGRFS